MLYTSTKITIYGQKFIHRNEFCRPVYIYIYIYYNNTSKSFLSFLFLQTYYDISRGYRKERYMRPVPTITTHFFIPWSPVFCYLFSYSVSIISLCFGDDFYQKKIVNKIMPNGFLLQFLYNIILGSRADLLYGEAYRRDA